MSLLVWICVYKNVLSNIYKVSLRMNVQYLYVKAFVFLYEFIQMCLTYAWHINNDVLLFTHCQQCSA